MSRKSYSLFVVVIVVAVLTLSQLARSGSGGGGDTSTPSGCQPGNAQTVDGKPCTAPTSAPVPTAAPKVQPTVDTASNAAKTAVQNAGKLLNLATSSVIWPIIDTGLREPWFCTLALRGHEADTEELVPRTDTVNAAKPYRAQCRKRTFVGVDGRRACVQ